MNARWFLFGAGYSARAFARLMEGTGIVGTTRAAENFGRLERAGISPLLYGGRLTPEIETALGSTTHLLVSAAPREQGDPLLGLLEGRLAEKMSALRWVGYLSTVGVYGDRQGGWVDEESECQPKSPHSAWRLEAERGWQALAGPDLAIAVLRLSGIYGPGRNALLDLERGTARRVIKPGQVFNRIHVADIAGAIRHLGERELGGVFNVTDDLPAPADEVVAYAAGLTGAEPPPEIPFEEAPMSAMGRSFYEENRRVANHALKGTGFRLIYPDYRAAFAAMWKAGDWRGESMAARAQPIHRKGTIEGSSRC